ncbi:unnamed protein product [Rhizophagus irregularis]|nr:unnamed protein product [Rhizophagus irregularis]
MKTRGNIMFGRLMGKGDRTKEKVMEKNERKKRGMKEGGKDNDKRRKVASGDFVKKKFKKVTFIINLEKGAKAIDDYRRFHKHVDEKEEKNK